MTEVTKQYMRDTSPTHTHTQAQQPIRKGTGRRAKPRNTHRKPASREPSVNPARHDYDSLSRAAAPIRAAGPSPASYARGCRVSSRSLLLGAANPAKSAPLDETAPKKYARWNWRCVFEHWSFGSAQFSLRSQCQATWTTRKSAAGREAIAASTQGHSITNKRQYTSPTRRGR
jgi:hypothetical protein